jgi:hypothetical protein
MQYLSLCSSSVATGSCILNHCRPSKDESSSVCSQLKIIMLRSYLDKGFPLSLSTSLIVNGRFLFALCFTTRSTAALVAEDGTDVLVLGVEPGTVRWVAPEPTAAVVVIPPAGLLVLLIVAAAVAAVTSSWSRLNSLCDNRSKALYVVRRRRRM